MSPGAQTATDMLAVSTSTFSATSYSSSFGIQVNNILLFSLTRLGWFVGTAGRNNVVNVYNFSLNIFLVAIIGTEDVFNLLIQYKNIARSS